MSVTTSQMLLDLQGMANVVSAVFASWKQIVILESPTFTFNDILLGIAWVVITIDWINRMRAPKVTNG